MLPEAPHLAVPTETKVRTTTLDLNFTDQHATAIPDVDTVSAPSVDIAEDIAFNTVRSACVGIGKHTPVCQERLVILPEDRVRVNGRGATGVFGAIAMNQVCVGNVDGFFGGREADAIGAPKAVCHHTNVTSGGIKAVDQLWELRFRPKPLLVAIDGVGEPDGAVRMDDDVIWRIERA